MLPPLMLTPIERESISVEGTKIVFDLDGFYSVMLERFGIALSFGCMFPLLMFMIMASILSTATLQTTLLYAFLKDPAMLEEATFLKENLGSFFEQNMHPIYSPRWIILAIAVAYALFFALDSVGDEFGLGLQSTIFAVLTVLCPLSLSWTCEVAIAKITVCGVVSNNKEGKKDVQMASLDISDIYEENDTSVKNAVLMHSSDRRISIDSKNEVTF